MSDFVKLVEPIDQWMQPWELKIDPTLSNHIGLHTFTIDCSLVDYPSAPVFSMLFNIQVYEKINNLPVFQLIPPQTMAIQMTSVKDLALPHSWKYTIPKLFDVDGDKVTLTVDLSGTPFIEID